MVEKSEINKRKRSGRRDEEIKKGKVIESDKRVKRSKTRGERRGKG